MIISDIQDNLVEVSRQTLMEMAFNSWISDLLIRKSEFDQPNSTRFSSQTIYPYYSKHLYFVTMHFHPCIKITQGNQSELRTDNLFHVHYKRWYMAICKSLLGPRFNKKTKHQPFSLAFFDVEGSRYAKPAPAPQIPHIHALLLIHPQYADSFRKMVRSGTFTKIGGPWINSVTIEPFKNNGQGTRSIISYATKYTRLMLGNNRADTLWSVYPDVDPKQYPFFKDKQIPTRTRFLNRLKRYR